MWPRCLLPQLGRPPPTTAASGRSAAVGASLRQSMTDTWPVPFARLLTTSLAVCAGPYRERLLLGSADSARNNRDGRGPDQARCEYLAERGPAGFE